MPNHIQSQVEITGDKDKIAKLIKDLKLVQDPNAEKNQFDFNAIIAMPEELNITSGSTTDLGIIAWGGHPKGAFSTFESYQHMPWWNERYPGIDTAEKLKAYLKENEKEAYELGKKAVNNFKKYGYTTWYEWANANWGTKWNAYDVKYIAGNETGFVVEIQTAWDSPRPIWEALREQGFTVKGVMFGEMDGFEMIGGEEDNPFEAYLDVKVDYCGEIENV